MGDGRCEVLDGILKMFENAGRKGKASNTVVYYDTPCTKFWASGQIEGLVCWDECREETGNVGTGGPRNTPSWEMMYYSRLMMMDIPHSRWLRFDVILCETSVIV